MHDLSHYYQFSRPLGSRSALLRTLATLLARSSDGPRYELVAVTSGQLWLLRLRSTCKYPERTCWTWSRNAFMVMVQVRMNALRNLEENDYRSPLLNSPKRTSEDGWAYGTSRYPAMHETGYRAQSWFSMRRMRILKDNKLTQNQTMGHVCCTGPMIFNNSDHIWCLWALTTTMRLLSTRTHATLFRKTTFNFVSACWSASYKDSREEIYNILM